MGILKVWFVTIISLLQSPTVSGSWRFSTSPKCGGYKLTRIVANRVMFNERFVAKLFVKRIKL